MIKEIEELQALGETLTTDAIEYERWTTWVFLLEEALKNNRSSTLSVKNPERKWELVSAYQKSVRRGQTDLALHLMCGMVSLSLERAYMWRRICTTAAEDVGAGSPLLMMFVIACSAIWSPGKCDGQTSLNLWGFLTEQMCKSQKSRIYCAYSIVENALTNKEQVYKAFDSSFQDYGKKIRDVLLGTKGQTPRDKWLEKNNWRAEGMLVGPMWHEALSPSLQVLEYAAPEPLLFKGLPDYAYDKHTRVGGKVCNRLVYNLHDLWVKYGVVGKGDTVGWALFFEEGGLIQDELYSPEVAHFEGEVVAERLGLPWEGWCELRQGVRMLLSSGKVNENRLSVLNNQGY